MPCSACRSRTTATSPGGGSTSTSPSASSARRSSSRPTGHASSSLDAGSTNEARRSSWPSSARLRSLRSAHAAPPIARPDPVTYPIKLDYEDPLPGSLAPLGQGVIMASTRDEAYLAFERRDDLGGFVPAPIGRLTLTTGGHDVLTSPGTHKPQIPLFQQAAGGKINSFTFTGNPTGPTPPPDNGNGKGVTPPPPPTPGNNVPPANQGFGGLPAGNQGRGNGGSTTTTTRRNGGGTTTTTTRRRRPPPTTTTTPATTATTTTSTTTPTTTGGGGGGGGSSSTPAPAGPAPPAAAASPASRSTACRRAASSAWRTSASGRLKGRPR